MEALKAALKNLKAKGLDVSVQIKEVGDEAEEINQDQFPGLPLGAEDQEKMDPEKKLEKPKEPSVGEMLGKSPSMSNLGKAAKNQKKG